jgi:hypothetical protein
MRMIFGLPLSAAERAAREEMAMRSRKISFIIMMGLQIEAG